MDMFYTDADGLILEHWDTIAPYIAQTKSGEGMTAGSKDVDLGADTEANKAMVLEYTKQVRQEADLSKLNTFVALDLVQHAPNIEAGRDGLKAWLGSDEAGTYEMMFQLIGQGDFVVTYGKRHAGDDDIAVFDLYRLTDGKIVEHWMNEEVIGPRETWGNSGKF